MRSFYQINYSIPAGLTEKKKNNREIETSTSMSIDRYRL